MELYAFFGLSPRLANQPLDVGEGVKRDRGHGGFSRTTPRNALTISRTAGASSPGTEIISRCGRLDLGRPRPRFLGLTVVASSFMFAPHGYFSIAYFAR